MGYFPASRVWLPEAIHIWSHMYIHTYMHIKPRPRSKVKIPSIFRFLSPQLSPRCSFWCRMAPYERCHPPSTGHTASRWPRRRSSSWYPALVAGRGNLGVKKHERSETEQGWTGFEEMPQIANHLHVWEKHAAGAIFQMHGGWHHKCLAFFGGRILLPPKYVDILEWNMVPAAEIISSVVCVLDVELVPLHHANIVT